VFFRHLLDAGVLRENPFESLRQDVQQRMLEELPITKLKRMVLEIGESEGWTEKSEEFQAGLVMLAPLEIGTMAPESVSRFTGVPLALVEQFAQRLRASGIWRNDGRIGASWAAAEAGNLAFMLDVWVATGELERLPIENEGVAVSEKNGEEP